MIAFAAAVTKPEQHARCAVPGMRRSAEPDSVFLDGPATGTIFESYNAILDRAAALDGLEALVLVHQDAELDTPGFPEVIREALADPDVGVVGCVGAVGVRSIAWWEASVTLSSFTNRFDEHGGGDLPAFSWTWDDAPPYARTGEVETLDGFVLVLSPWVVQNVRFDASLGGFHGYDLDFCLQVREAGRKVVTADFRAVHHRPLQMVPDLDEWELAHARVAEKWEGRMPHVGWAPGSWRERALRAEAEAEAAKVVAHWRALELEVKVAQLRAAIDEATNSVGWKLTAPLRRA